MSSIQYKQNLNNSIILPFSLHWNQYKNLFDGTTVAGIRAIFKCALPLLAAPFRGCHSESSAFNSAHPVSSYAIPTIFMSSFIAFMNPLCDSTLFFLQGSFIFNMHCPVNLYMSKPSQPCPCLISKWFNHVPLTCSF